MCKKCAKVCRAPENEKSHEESYDSSWDFGALEGTRIPGPLIKSQMLYRLSYERIFNIKQYCRIILPQLCAKCKSCRAKNANFLQACRSSSPAVRCAMSPSAAEKPFRLFRCSLSRAAALFIVSYPQKDAVEFSRIAGFKRQGRAIKIKISELRGGKFHGSFQSGFPGPAGVQPYPGMTCGRLHSTFYQSEEKQAVFLHFDCFLRFKIPYSLLCSPL